MLNQFVKSSEFLTAHGNGGAFEKLVRVDEKPDFFGLLFRRGVDEREPVSTGHGGTGTGDGTVGTTIG